MCSVIPSRPKSKKLLRQQRQRAAFARDVKALKQWAQPRQLSLDGYLAGWKQVKLPRGEPEFEFDHSRPLGGQWEYWWRYVYKPWEQGRAFENTRHEREACRSGERAALSEGAPSWGRLRALVYSRDRGVCQACLIWIPWERYHLGHLKERLTGGLDTPDNLVVMCENCNMVWKPVHETTDEAREWLRSGGAIGEKVSLIQKVIRASAEEAGQTVDEYCRAMNDWIERRNAGNEAIAGQIAQEAVA